MLNKKYEDITNQEIDSKILSYVAALNIKHNTKWKRELNILTVEKKARIYKGYWN